MNNKTRLILVILVYVILGLSALPRLIGPKVMDGDVLQVFQGTASNVIQSCLAGQACTRVFLNGQYAVFVKPLTDGFAFVGVDLKQMLFVKDIAQIAPAGNFCNQCTYVELKQWFINNGWSAISSAQIGATIASQLLTLAQGEFIIPVFFFSPSGFMGFEEVGS